MTCDGEPRHVIRLLGHGHCARGSARCARCREAEARPARPVLLDLAPDRPEAARPVLEVWPGRFRVYDVVREFASREDALAYGREHGIEARLE
jgi:hypothetical protein